MRPELQDHLDAIDRITVQIERNRAHLFGKSEGLRAIACELNGLLAAKAEAHWDAIRRDFDIVGLGVAA